MISSNSYLRAHAWVGLLAALGPAIDAAPITWGPVVGVSTDSGNSADVSTNGSLVEAYNAAISSYAGGIQTVNGVPFTPTTQLLPADASVAVDFSIGTNGGDAGYDALLSTADYGGGDSTTITIGDGDGNATVTGPGLLQLGLTYEIQVWFVDDRAPSNNRVMGFSDTAPGDLAQVNDQYVIGTFTADAPTQTLFLDTVSPASGFGNCHITAYQIRKLSGITWGEPVAVSTGPDNSSDVSTQGTLVEAFNAASTSYTGGNQTVNGVPFVATTSLLDLNGTLPTDFSVGTNGGDASYDAILSTADFGGGESTTIVIGDGDGGSGVTGAGLLQAGQSYKIQIWFVDDRDDFDDRVMGFGSGASGSIAQLNDQYVIGTFTADATTQTLFLDTISPSSGFGNCHITAYQVRAIEPGTSASVTLSTTADPVSGPFSVSIDFSEEVIGLEISDFSVSNGSVSGLQPATGPASSYTALVTPTDPGVVSVQLPAGAANSAANDPSLASAILQTNYELPQVPTVTISGSRSTDSTGTRIFISFSEAVTGLEASDFVVSNGSLSALGPRGRDRSTTNNSYQPSQRHYSAHVIATMPGTVEIQLPAGSATSLDGNDEASLESNSFSFECTSDFGDRWVVDEAAEWIAATSSSTNLGIAGGFAEPSDDLAEFSSIVQSFPNPRKAISITFQQSAVWDHWLPLGYDIQDSVGGDAPVFIPVGPDDYYVLALSGAVYHAWHSTDMVNWTSRGPVVSGAEGRWVTSAEFKDGNFYIYSDFPNDHDSHVFRDDDLGDGNPGTYLGPVLERDGSGSDLAAFRDDADGLFHLIHEDWSPLNARQNAWDSPLAGHVSSTDGINGFVEGEHAAAVDERTTPTGTFGSYDHPFVPFDPTYEIHTPAQDAFGDWTAIKVGGRYYLFGDFDPPGQSIRAARFSSDSIHGQFEFAGEIITGGHPDPTVGFAEGQFYLITQYNDFYSPGPWVDGVEARVGVDVEGDGTIDTWTAWQTIQEQYDHTPGYIRVVTTTPAQIDLSGLPAARGFAFEFRINDTIVSGVSPIMDKVEMSFFPSNFQQWANSTATPAEPKGDHNLNGIPNLVEFALGSSELPLRGPDGSLVMAVTAEALADGYQVELEFSQDLDKWTIATLETTDVRLVNVATTPNGDEERGYQIQVPNGRPVFWRFAVF